ncbi:D-alanyl-D-alanine carboxypeptidase/D-alanyl-D-alanine-endopeptidase [Pseudonocardia sp. GCM10023141]|uniref:D-alanyl-D-alanine carboxypeptidase/D-alanyl-D-alanine endopeptidase n=1 Tax=Pseudonocardia sp. GCM10023141 TaxID=3252653 RepID=UPI0036134E5D
MRRGVLVLVVLAVAGASGGAVALTAPSLVANLSPEKPVPAPVVPRAMLGPLSAGAPLPTAAGLATALGTAAGDMPGKFGGTVLDPANGTVLWQHNPEQALAPGSTGKILTTSAALLTLNPTDTFITRVVAGTDPGTVVLVGGGDPTLTALPAGKTGVYPDPSRLVDLAAKVKKTAKAPITKVVIDTSRYKGPLLAQGWDPADIPAGNITPIVPLMIDGGRVDPTMQDGKRTTTPADAAGVAFAKLLGLDEDAVEPGTAPAGAQTLAAVASAPFADLVETTIRESDNVLAEALAREVAIVKNGEPSFTGAAAQTMAALSQAGFDPTGAVLSDGSGLSTDDRVPPKVLGALLAAAAAPAQGDRDTEFLRPILTGLPVAGGDGTLGDRFGRTTDAAAGRGVVRAKTGTLDNVSSLAGVVTDADGRLLVFALMSNGVMPAKARPLLDDLAATLGGCGCR